MIVVPPAVRVFTVPEVPTVATDGLLEDQVPPVILFVKKLTSPAQILVSPSISPGTVLTVIFCVL